MATEGVNLKNAACIAMMRPTQSWSLYMQMLGRGTRLLGSTLEESVAAGAAEAGEAIERTEASEREAEASEREAEAAEDGDGGAGKEMEQREVETRRKETQIDMERCEEAEREEGKKGQQTSTEKEAERCNVSNGMHNTGQWTTVPLHDADGLDNRNQATRRIACRGTITLNNRR